MLVRASGLRGRPKAAGPVGAPLAVSSATAAIATGSFSAARRDAEGGQPAAAHVPPAAAAQAHAPPPQRPVLDIWGGGMWFYWKAGVLSFLQQQYGSEALSRVQLHGSSSGAMVAVLAACGEDLRRSAEHTARVLQEQRVQDRCGATAACGWLPCVCIQAVHVTQRGNTAGCSSAAARLNPVDLCFAGCWACWACGVASRVAAWRSCCPRTPTRGALAGSAPPTCLPACQCLHVCLSCRLALCLHRLNIRCNHIEAPRLAVRRCTGRVRLRVTAWPTMQPIFLEAFRSKRDVIDACLASGHLPFLLDGRLAATLRGACPLPAPTGCPRSATCAAVN